jgi:S1-C subfamily serine protease
MISSATGSYVGYSFAVPSNIARKIIQDIMEFGNVQRGILGVEGGELNNNASKELGVKQTEGFYIKKVNKKSGAEKAGLAKGDIIIQLDNQKIATFEELTSYIYSKRPNDVVKVTFIRNEKTITVPVTLIKNENSISEFKGLQLQEITASDKQRFNINFGVKVSDIDNEKLNGYAKDLIGGIIISIDNQQAIDLETVSKILSNKENNDSIQLEMITKKGQIIRLIL